MKKFLVLISLLFMNMVFAADMRFVQVTDIRFSENNNLMPDLVQNINKINDVEFVIFTGDNLAKPVKNDLVAFLKEAKKLNCPFYIVIGDHDVNKHKELSKAEYIKIIKKHVKKYKPESPNYTFEKNNVLFIVVDGAKDVIPGTNGFYKDETLNWLENELNDHQKQNIIIFQHFPLIPPADKETYYTYNPEKYLAIIEQHKNIKAVISGHFGVNKERDINGTLHISTAPLPEYRIIDILNYETPHPLIWAQLKRLNVNKPD